VRFVETSLLIVFICLVEMYFNAGLLIQIFVFRFVAHPKAVIALSLLIFVFGIHRAQQNFCYLAIFF